MGIRQWINKAVKKAGRGWVGSYKKRLAEKRARKRERQLQREIDEAMTRRPVSGSLPLGTPIPPIEQDDWFNPPLITKPQT